MVPERMEKSALGGSYGARPSSGQIARFIPCRPVSGRGRDYRGGCPLHEIARGSAFFADLVGDGIQAFFTSQRHG